MYQDGYIIAAFSRFIYFIKLEEPSLFSEPVYQFDELIPSNYAANTCNCNKFGITFSTFGQYANWLQDRVSETLWWFLTNGYWSNSWGMLQEPSSNATGVAINMQVGFGRALLFIGLTAGEQSFLDKAKTIANLYKSHIFFFDVCENTFYNADVLRLTNDNTYWWYHSGWSRLRRNCFPFFNIPKYSGFVRFIEDISHGGIVTWLPLDFYNFQPNTPFTTNDMIRFRNTFSKNIYDGAGGFYNAVDGTDAQIFNKVCGPEVNNQPPCPHNLHKMVSFNYMPYYEFDGADNTATTPNVYESLMDFYVSEITGSTSLPSGYGGQTNKGHADVVQAQWIRECPDLTLYNRKMVYDQDFTVEGTLTVAPEETPGNSYADPIISEQKFTVEPGTTVNMVAGNTIVLKPGFHAKAGSNFSASIDPNLCSGSNKMGNSNSSGGNEDSAHQNISNAINYTTDTLEIKEEENYIFDNSMTIYPNPFTEYSLIQFSLQKESTVTLTVFDNFGRPVFDKINARQLQQGIYNVSLGGDNLAAGVYHCVLTINNDNRLTQTIIKE